MKKKLLRNIGEQMPKDSKKITVQAHLLPEEYAEFKSVGDKKDWPMLRLNKNLIQWYLRNLKNNPSLIDFPDFNLPKKTKS